MSYLMTEDGITLPLWEYTLTDSETGLPIVSADVWATTDVGGGNMIAKETTNAFGVANFYLDPGTYYFWRKKAGYSFANPQTQVVT